MRPLSVFSLSAPAVPVVGDMLIRWQRVQGVQERRRVETVFRLPASSALASAEWRGCSMERAMQQRRRFKQTQSLEERLSQEAKRLLEEAEALRPGPARDALIRRARQAETGSHMSDWLRSPGLRAPT
jgi:hypothetical protein